MGRMLAARQISAVELVASIQSRLDEVEPKTRSLITATLELALKAANDAQVQIDAKEGGPMTGVPIAIKDNIVPQGVRTTCGSRLLEAYVPPFDATVVARLAAHGCPILGKTNLDEFAMGSSTETSAFGSTRNPWDLDRSPGGSSGGSAAIVAAGGAPMALGSDTGGSIRQPAAFCGIVGFKPTYGRCSRYGLVAHASSLDQIGPMARTVEDAALLASIVSGHDPMDGTSHVSIPIDAGPLKLGSMQGARVGIVAELCDADPLVAASVDRAAEGLRREGVSLVDVSLPSVKCAVTLYYLIAPAEASSNLARFDGVRYGERVEGDRFDEMVAKTRGAMLGHEVKARIMMGTYALSAGFAGQLYERATELRRAMIREFDEAFKSVDFLIGPTTPTPAFRTGEFADNPMALKRIDRLTIPASLVGAPAITLPCGQVEGLPVGLQILAAPGFDEDLLAFAFCVESMLGESRWPSLP